MLFFLFLSYSLPPASPLPPCLVQSMPFTGFPNHWVPGLQKGLAIPLSHPPLHLHLNLWERKKNNTYITLALWEGKKKKEKNGEGRQANQPASLRELGTQLLAAGRDVGVRQNLHPPVIPAPRAAWGLRGVCSSQSCGQSPGCNVGS